MTKKTESTFTRAEAETLLKDPTPENVGSFNNRIRQWRQANIGNDKIFDLSNIDLSNRKFSAAPNGEGIDLRWVNLDGANLCGTRMSNAEILDVSFNGATCNSLTELPTTSSEELRASMREIPSSSINNLLQGQSAEASVGRELK